MPVYDYLCPQHGPVTELRKIAAREAPARCPDCGGEALRTVAAPRLALMAPDNRRAWATNERSQHEPRRARRASCGHVHAAGEGCSGTRKPAASTAGLSAAKPGGRPWMLGH